MDASSTEGEVRLAADIYLSRKRQNQVFGVAFRRSLLPIQLVVHNAGERVLNLDRDHIFLNLPESTPVAARGWKSALGTIREVGSELVDATTATGNPRDPFLTFDLGGLWDGRTRRNAELLSRDLPAVTRLGPGRSVRGVVYFVRTKSAQTLPTGSLEVKLTTQDGDAVWGTLPLSDLARVK